MKIVDYDDSIHIDVKRGYLHLQLRNKEGRMLHYIFMDELDEEEHVLEIDGGMFIKNSKDALDNQLVCVCMLLKVIQFRVL